MRKLYITHRHTVTIVSGTSARRGDQRDGASYMPFGIFVCSRAHEPIIRQSNGRSSASRLASRNFCQRPNRKPIHIPNHPLESLISAFHFAPFSAGFASIRPPKKDQRRFSDCPTPSPFGDLCDAREVFLRLCRTVVEYGRVRRLTRNCGVAHGAPSMSRL